MGKISKAVIPVAGLGTRFLPATKALPKEMLPVVDKPAIQYVVEEAVASGLSHVLMVTGRNKNALENHFDRAAELEQLLEAKGAERLLDTVSEATELADIHYVRQGDPKGLGHAISKAETFVGNEPFAVLLGDDIIHNQETLLIEMLSLAERTSGSVIGLVEVPDSELSKYGVAEVKGDSTGAEELPIKITGLVEKPSKEDAPSNYAVIGRYVLQPGIFRVLKDIAPGVGGEIQLTDALNLMAINPDLAGPVYGFVFHGRRFDTGDKLSYLKAIVELAVERDEFGEDLQKWLFDFSARKLTN